MDRKRALRFLLMGELAVGIFLTPLFLPLLVSAVHISLAITWMAVALGERLLVRAGWLSDNGEHDKVRLSTSERETFDALVGNYREAEVNRPDW